MPSFSMTRLIWSFDLILPLSMQWHWSIMSSYCATATDLMLNAKPSQLYVYGGKRPCFKAKAVHRSCNSEGSWHDLKQVLVYLSSLIWKRNYFNRYVGWQIPNLDNQRCFQNCLCQCSYYPIFYLYFRPETYLHAFSSHLHLFALDYFQNSVKCLCEQSRFVMQK